MIRIADIGFEKFELPDYLCSSTKLVQNYMNEISIK